MEYQRVCLNSWAELESWQESREQFDMILEAYDNAKANAKSIADNKRVSAEQNYRAAVLKDARPYAMSEAEDKYRKSLRDILKEYQDTVAAALAAA